jgi:hypothetical protein
MSAPGIAATPWKESTGTCACCGKTTKTIWGDLSDGSVTRAVYFVQWTVRSPEHYPNIDLVIGSWGEGAKPTDRILVSLLFRPSRDGGSFMVTDGAGRPSDTREVCARALPRAEVAGTPLASEVFALVDTVWLTDPRIGEVKELNHGA